MPPTRSSASPPPSPSASRAGCSRCSSRQPPAASRHAAEPRALPSGGSRPSASLPPPRSRQHVSRRCSASMARRCGCTESSMTPSLRRRAGPARSAQCAVRASRCSCARVRSGTASPRLSSCRQVRVTPPLHRCYTAVTPLLHRSRDRFRARRLRRLAAQGFQRATAYRLARHSRSFQRPESGAHQHHAGWPRDYDHVTAPCARVTRTMITHASQTARTVTSPGSHSAHDHITLTLTPTLDSAHRLSRTAYTPG